MIVLFFNSTMKQTMGLKFISQKNGHKLRAPFVEVLKIKPLLFLLHDSLAREVVIPNNCEDKLPVFIPVLKYVCAT